MIYTRDPEFVQTALENILRDQFQGDDYTIRLTLAESKLESLGYKRCADAEWRSKETLELCVDGRWRERATADSLDQMNQIQQLGIEPSGPRWRPFDVPNAKE